MIFKLQNKYSLKFWAVFMYQPKDGPIGPRGGGADRAEGAAGSDMAEGPRLGPVGPSWGRGTRARCSNQI